MIKTVYQKPEIRDSNDNIIQQGAFGKNTALANATNDGWIDYVANDLEFLYDLAKDEVVPVSALPASGDMNKTYLLTTTGVCYRWDGTAWIEISSSEAVGRAETAANLAEQWATKTDGTVADNEYSAKYYANSAQQSADDAQDVADDMADHLAQIDQNTGGVSANSKRISNIEKLLQGNLYDYQTDSTSAYTKSVPAGAMPYAGLEQIGGKTVVWNQLVDSGTTTVPTINGRKYYTLIDGTASIVTADGTAISVVDDTADMVCDLTLMFCSGNEPSTVAEFEAMFPADYYAYNKGTLLSAGVTSVVSKDANNATLQTYSIPAEVQALEGYGWSAGTAYNYVDFERKVFVQNVARMDLGTLTWKYISIDGSVSFRATSFNVKSCTNSQVANIISFMYMTKSVNNVLTNTEDKTIGVSSANAIVIYNSAYTTASDFASAMSGVYAYCELATPIETDISQYLTDDNLIQVEVCGTLTFPNSNGTDYQIPVPSEEEYMIDLQSALGD